MEKGKLGTILFIGFLAGSAFVGFKYFQGKISAATCQEDLESEVIMEIQVSSLDDMYEELVEILDKHNAVYEEDDILVEKDGSNLVVDIEASITASALVFDFSFPVKLQKTLTGRFGGPVSVSGGGAAGAALNRGMRGVSDAKSLRDQAKGAGQDLSEE